jgi:hypothetical protein
VITQTDIFKTFVEMFAGGRAGLCLTLEVPERREIFGMLSSAALDLGGSHPERWLVLRQGSWRATAGY